MIAYPSSLPCPLLSSGSSIEQQAFIRTQFDFGIRQTRIPRGYKSQSFSIVLPFYLLDEFKAFWLSINYGADPFEFDYLVHGSDNITKVVRFITTYSMKALGNNMFSISSSLEVLSEGTSKAGACPLVPYNTLTPSETLTPC